MSILKEISESHDTIKAFALNLFLLPFWYVAIYLFNNEFYVKADTLILISMCIVISIVSSLITSLLYDAINSALDSTPNAFFDSMAISTIILSMWLSILIVFFYSLGFLYEIYIYFYWFLVIYTSPILLIFLIYLISPPTKEKQKNKKKE